MRLKTKDFSEVFQEKLSLWLQKKIYQLGLIYRPMKETEKEQYLLTVIREILEKDLPQAGPQRLKRWEKGWRENLVDLRTKKPVEAVIPHYFGKYPVIRFKQDFIKPLSKNFEYHSLAVITYWLLEKYFKSATTIYEFGCGTGHNLLRAREVNQGAEVWGLDLAKSSQKIIKKLGFKAAGFDFFKPNQQFKLRPNSCILTVASVEQLGKRFKPIVQYWLKNKIKLCVNIEPINELLDKDNLLDYLSIEYAKKRNYVAGYLIYLKQLEKQGKIIIHRAQRTYIGSLFIDGYSVIVWSPK